MQKIRVFQPCWQQKAQILKVAVSEKWADEAPGVAGVLKEGRAAWSRLWKSTGVKKAAKNKYETGVLVETDLEEKKPVHGSRQRLGRGLPTFRCLQWTQLAKIAASCPFSNQYFCSHNSPRVALKGPWILYHTFLKNRRKNNSLKTLFFLNFPCPAHLSLLQEMSNINRNWRTKWKQTRLKIKESKKAQARPVLVLLCSSCWVLSNVAGMWGKRCAGLVLSLWRIVIWRNSTNPDPGWLNLHFVSLGK